MFLYIIIGANSSKNEQYSLVLAGKILHLLNVQWDSKIKNVDDVEIFQQPKDVKVSRDFAVGKCQLPVTTTKVFVGDTLESNPSQVPLGDWAFGSRVYTVALMAGTVWPKVDSDAAQPAAFISPFWIMRYSHKKEECNMELVYDKGCRKLSLDNAFVLPFARNFKGIKQGDSLILHNELAKKESTVEELQPVCTRRRVKGPDA